MGILKGGIGFFDSGLGGLTVLFSALSLVGDLPVYYYGDNLRAPYGNLPPEKIREYVFEAFDVFKRLEVRAAVLACNTATAVCAEELRKSCPFPVVGAEPAVMPAARAGGEIFVLATRATAESVRLHNLCARARERYPTAHIRVFACDSLAGAIEEHLFKREVYDFSPFFPGGRPQGVVLGCTHYVFLKERAEAFYRCPVYDGNEGIAGMLSCVLKEKNDRSGDFRPPATTSSVRRFSGTDIMPPSDGCVNVGNCGTESGAKAEEEYETLFLPKERFFGRKNIRSPIFLKNGQKNPEKDDFFRIFFLGSGKKLNKMACEQMFAINFGSKN